MEGLRVMLGNLYASMIHDDLTDRVIEQALEVKAGEAEERREESSPTPAPPTQLEPVEHQPSLL